MILTALAFAACSNDDPDSGKPIKPDANVPDPMGTITLSMRNDDETSLDGLYISDDDNFHGGSFVLADIGSVNGLGNVSSIPTVGWAEKVAVTPGHGYVAAKYSWTSEETYNVTFYRLYVIDYNIGAMSGGIIGANVKYQRPFNGVDDALVTDQKKVSAPKEGGEFQITFTNSSLIPFTVESSEEWCTVKKASTLSEPYLYDAIVVTCAPSYSQTDRKATVTLKTSFGKETEIEVSQVARGDFMELSTEEVVFDFDYQTKPSEKVIQLFTNIPLDEISVGSDEEWLSGTIEQSKASEVRRRVRWIDGESETRASKDEPVESFLTVRAEPYFGNESRVGKLKLYRNNKVEKTVEVTQKGSAITIDPTSLTFESAGGTQSLNISGANASNLIFVVDQDGADWCSVNGYYSYQREVNVAYNPYEEERSTTISVYYSGNRKYPIEEIKVKQEGMIYKDQYIYFDRYASNYTLAFPLKDNPKITSSEPWCTASPSGNNLIIRVTSTTENRKAEITVEGVNAKIFVSQSKYAVGDTYSENGVEGTVVKMGNGEGRILKYLGESLVWSTENVDNIDAKNTYFGEFNCRAIMTIPGWEDLYPAMKAVQDLNTGDVTGWYIPASGELSDMKYTGGYGGPFWSSTEYSTTRQYIIHNNGSSSIASKSSTYGVVAAHAFYYWYSE